MALEFFDPLQYAVFALVVTMAFAVRGATGFGSGVVAVPLAALALPVQVVIPVVNNLLLFSNTAYSARNWRHVEWREMLRLMPFAVLGVLLGLYLFYRLDPRATTKALGVFVIAYSVRAMVTAGRNTNTAASRPSWPLTASLSAGGGLVGALFGSASSPFYVMYLQALRISRDAFRATMTMITLMQVVLRVGGYAGMGLLDTKALLISAMVLPFMMLGARFGDVIANCTSPRTFNRMVGAMLLASGAALLLK